jgi:hypothetical protein
VPWIGKNEAVELEIVKIADPGATETYQMMVMIGIAVEPGHRIRVVRSAYHAELYQGFQPSINSRFYIFTERTVF